MRDLLDDGQWQDETRAALDTIAAWRRAHPRATFAEIEAAVDDQLQRVRARVVTDTVQVSPAAAFGEDSERPACPDCGGPLQAHGVKTRRITNHRGETVELPRTYGYCPRCDAGVFPPG